MKRVVLVTHYFPQHRGGVERVAGQIAARLAEQGQFAFTWFSADTDAPPEAVAGITPVPVRVWNGLEAIGLPWPVWLGGMGKLRKAVREADAVHLHDYLYFGNLLAFALAAWYRKPVCITQHIGDIPYRNPALRTLHRWLNRTLGRWMLGRALRVVFISEAVREQFLRFTQFRNPPEFWPNGVDRLVFHPPEAQARIALREKLGVAEQRVYLFAGRFVEKKGMPLLRKLAAAAPEARWWFAGWGTLDPGAWNMGNVRVFASRAGASLAELYQAADVLVLPSRSEGFAMVIQEAMACGTPVLLSEAAAEGAPAARELMHVCPLEPAATAVARWNDALVAIRPDAQWRQAVQAFVQREWTWETVAANYARLFHAL